MPKALGALVCGVRDIAYCGEHIRNSVLVYNGVGSLADRAGERAVDKQVAQDECLLHYWYRWHLVGHRPVDCEVDAPSCDYLPCGPHQYTGRQVHH